MGYLCQPAVSLAHLTFLVYGEEISAERICCSAAKYYHKNTETGLNIHYKDSSLGSPTLRAVIKAGYRYFLL